MSIDCRLRKHRQTGLVQFTVQRVFINLSRETGPRSVQNPECAAADEPRKPIHPRTIRHYVSAATKAEDAKAAQTYHLRWRWN